MTDIVLLIVLLELDGPCEGVSGISDIVFNTRSTGAAYPCVTPLGHNTLPAQFDITKPTNLSFVLIAL